MIKLSFSTINSCLQPENSHNWANKTMGAKVPDNEFFKNGHRLHKIIQEHISGKTPNDFLKHIPYTFPVVEEVDFDKRCEFTIKISEKYGVRGFIDAQDPDNKRFCEIKTGNTLWSLGKFQQSYQRKVYALAKPDYTESILITALNDTEWPTQPPKLYKVPLTQKDRDEALAWIEKAIKVLESGDYTGGLDEEGKCTNRYCMYGANCQFK